MGQRLVVTASVDESISETLIRPLHLPDETTSTKALETEKTETEPLSEVTVITAEWADGERKISVKRGRLTPELVRLLQGMVPIRGPDEPGFDDLIGTAKPQAEKDTWPVNSESICKLLAREGVIVSRSQIRGVGAGENVPATANLLLHTDATRARTSLNLLSPRLERLKGKNLVRGNGSVTIESVQSTKDSAQAPINQGWSWACSNRIIDAGVHKRISDERSYSARFEPYHEPAQGAPIRKRQR